MTRTAIICLALWLILFALSALGILPGIIVTLAAIFEAILILVGSKTDFLKNG